MQELHREIISSSPIYSFILQDLKIRSVASGLVVAHLPLTANLLNGKQILHGSVSATIIDWIGGLVIASTGAQKRGASVDIHVTYSGSAKEGDLLIIEGKSRKVGRNLAFIGVEIRAQKAGGDGEERIVVTGSHTKYVG
ncbi:Thioesterase/thiol ester dehydrase-isomerase [Athelia psychrophila]|uniref:Thioesterase/thiol ester dehydrase-isomerase n=1 Tax=Athelia psychrophila TaxID=1759441 RepID=A0A166VAX0_9AGAM|nr:Thioesterase/thiol ester dehydrase-isomerase [Fibularhizoctonia sp. CBS 109695]